MIALVVVFGFLFWVGDGLNFKCGNNQLLFVSDFGQNTVRMHCHGMDVCSALNKGKCGYFEGGHSCKDKLAFVSSVSQRSDSEGVFHDCCVIGDNKLDSGVLADYFEKDCFIYNMPDIGNGSIIGENGEVKRINYGFDLDKPKESVIDQRNSKMIVKNIRRYTKGYSISICRAHCNRNSLNTVRNFINSGGKEIHVNKRNYFGFPKEKLIVYSKETITNHSVLDSTSKLDSTTKFSILDATTKPRSNLAKILNRINPKQNVVKILEPRNEKIPKLKINATQAPNTNTTQASKSNTIQVPKANTTQEPKRLQPDIKLLPSKKVLPIIKILEAKTNAGQVKIINAADSNIENPTRLKNNNVIGSKTNPTEMKNRNKEELIKKNWFRNTGYKDITITHHRNKVMKKEQIRIDENELMEIARAIKTATNSLRESVIPILERPLRLLSLRSSRIQKYLKMKDTIKSQVKPLAPKTVRNPIAHKPTTHAPITHKSTIHPPIIHKLKIEGDAHPTVIDINTTTQSSRLSMKLLTAQLNERYKVMSQFPSMNHKAFGVRMSQPLADPISFDSSRTTLSPDSLFGIPIDDFIRFINERKKSMKKTTSTTTTTTIATTTAEDPRVFSKELLLEWLKERANFVAPSSSTTTAAPVQIETSKIFSDLRREILMSLLNEMNSKTSTAAASLILTTMPPKIVVGGETAKKVIDTSLDFDSEKDSKESTESEETTEVTKKVNIVVEPELDPNTNRPKNHAIPELFKLRLPRINSTTARPKLTPLPPKKVVLTTRRPKSLIEARITTRTPIPTTTTKLKLTTRPHFSFPDYTLVDDNLDPAHSRINLNSLSSKPSKSVRKKDELSKSKDGLAKVQAALQSVLQSIPLFAFKPKKDEIVSSFNTDKVIKTPDIIKLFNYSSPDYISSSTELA